MTKSSTKGRWWQFSIRSLLLVMVVVASYVAGWATAMQRVRRAEAQAKREAQRSLMLAQEARMQAERAAAALVQTQQALRASQVAQQKVTE